MIWRSIWKGYNAYGRWMSHLPKRRSRRVLISAMYLGLVAYATSIIALILPGGVARPWRIAVLADLYSVLAGVAEAVLLGDPSDYDSPAPHSWNPNRRAAASGTGSRVPPRLSGPIAAVTYRGDRYLHPARELAWDSPANLTVGPSASYSVWRSASCCFRCRSHFLPGPSLTTQWIGPGADLNLTG